MSTPARSTRAATLAASAAATSNTVPSRAAVPAATNSSDDDDDDASRASSPTPAAPPESKLPQHYFQNLPDDVLDGVLRAAANGGDSAGGAGGLADVLALHATCSRVSIRAQRILSSGIDLIGGNPAEQIAEIKKVRTRMRECIEAGRPFLAKYLRVENWVFKSDTANDDLAKSNEDFLSLLVLLASRNLFELTLAYSFVPATIFEEMYNTMNKFSIASWTFIRVSIESTADLDVFFLPSLDALLHLNLSNSDLQSLSLLEVTPSLLSLVVVSQYEVPYAAWAILKEMTRSLHHLAVAIGNPNQVSQDLLPHLSAEGERFILVGQQHPLSELFLGVGPDGWTSLLDAVRNLPRLKSLYVGLERSIHDHDVNSLRNAAPSLSELIIGAASWPDAFDSYVNALAFADLKFLATNWRPANSPKKKQAYRQRKTGNVTMVMMRSMGRRIPSLRKVFFLRGINEDGTGTGISVRLKRGPLGGVTPVFNLQSTFEWFEGRYEEWAEESL